MKTLIFSILMSLCAPAFSALAPLSVVTFRQFFRRSPMPELRELVKACGHPAEEWNSDVVHHPGQKIPNHLPAYHGGHFFRYALIDGSHVYVWTGEDDGPVMRADYISTSGHVAPLYLRPL
ncbi:MAG TPA: hypothetical protein VHY09_15635 [Candidatus Methylacidiphilales bacterium]|nr:hypothetical protein [Candidatus Methylacidiphilales bacterium]